MSQSNVHVIRGIYEALGRGDVPAVIDRLGENIEWREAEGFLYADRNPYLGAKAVLEGVFRRLIEEWEGFTVSPEAWLDAGDQVVTLGRYRGVYRATGKSIHAQFAHVWGVRDGRASRFQQYTDTRQFAEAAKEP